MARTSRLIPATQDTPSLAFSYNGLGALQYASGVASGLDYQDIKTDALGNRLWVRDDEQIDNVDRTRYHSIDQATGQLTSSTLGTPTCGPPGTGTKSCHPNWYEYELTQDHDLAGNVIATWGKETRGSDAFSADPIPTETRSFYDAADRLIYFNRHVNYVTPGEAGGVFEEYRYDAMVRRVHQPSHAQYADHARRRGSSRSLPPNARCVTPVATREHSRRWRCQ